MHLANMSSATPLQSTGNSRDHTRRALASASLRPIPAESSGRAGGLFPLGSPPNAFFLLHAEGLGQMLAHRTLDAKRIKGTTQLVRCG